MIAVTVNEIRRLINVLIIRPIRDLAHRTGHTGAAVIRPEPDTPTTSDASTLDLQP
jgi:hypothetical protein